MIKIRINQNISEVRVKDIGNKYRQGDNICKVWIYKKDDIGTDKVEVVSDPQDGFEFIKNHRGGGIVTSIINVFRKNPTEEATVFFQQHYRNRPDIQDAINKRSWKFSISSMG